MIFYSFPRNSKVSFWRESKRDSRMDRDSVMFYKIIIAICWPEWIRHCIWQQDKARDNISFKHAQTHYGQRCFCQCLRLLLSFSFHLDGASDASAFHFLWIIYIKQSKTKKQPFWVLCMPYAMESILCIYFLCNNNVHNSIWLHLKIIIAQTE